MPKTKEKLPHWDVSNIYSGLEADDYQSDIDKTVKMLDELETFIEKNGIEKISPPPEDIKGTASVLNELINRLNEIDLVLETLESYVYSFISTDSYNKTAGRRLSELEKIKVRSKRSRVRFQAWVGSLGDILDELCKAPSVAQKHRLVLDELLEQSRYLMDTKLEDLAAELSLSGGSVMWKLQGTVTSQLKMPLEREGKTEDLPMTILRNLASDPSEDVRKRAFEKEIEGWEKIRESVAFSLNGVKGAAVTMAKWQGRDDVLHAALDSNRIDREILDALLGAMKESFPSFRRYLKSKAAKLGKKKLPWWDLFAPVGEINLKYTWQETADFIVEQFSTFTHELGDFARRAFDNNWIDAEPRDGKRGGAFCMKVPAVEESRILANYDGSFDELTTLAHELGHGFHNYCQRGLPMLRRGAPMTLAETASIFCETIVFNAALDSAPPEAQVTILENQLMGANQVIVDIYSRFLFETEVIKRREKAELSADDFCEIIIDAQKQTYGDGLDQEHLHPYMWLLKPHYYYSDAHFYNYPYAFGLLFGLGVYAIYQKEGADFVPRYIELLESTGEGKVADLATRYGIDVKSSEFWKSSLRIIEERIDRYCES